MNKRIKENIEGYLYILPALLVVLFIYAFPIIKNIQFSFLDLSQRGAPFVGFRNYRVAFTDKTFFISIKNNFTLFLLIPLLVIFSLLFSALLYERLRGWKFYRTVIFLPYVLSITVVGIFFSFFFQGNGVLNMFLRKIGLEFLALDWLGSTKLALPTVMIVVLWKEFGYGVVLFLARLMTVQEVLYDAAEIDGAGWFQKLWYITIPQLATVIEFYIFLALITMLSWVFNYIYVITYGGPAQKTYVGEFYIYIQAFKQNSIGVSAVVALFLFFITGLLAFFSYRIRRRLYAEYE